MKCQQCGHADATVHVTDVVDKVRRERHLCEACADAQKLFVAPATGEPDTAAGLNLQALVDLVFQSPDPVAAGVPPAGLNCPACGLQYAAFRAARAAGVRGGLRRLPRPTTAAIRAAAPLRQPRGEAPRRLDCYGLRDRLAAAVAGEDFEAAASLRDELRRKERDR